MARRTLSSASGAGYCSATTTPIPAFVTPLCVPLAGRRGFACNFKCRPRPQVSRRRPTRRRLIASTTPPSSKEPVDRNVKSGTERQSFSLGDLPIQSLESAPERPGAYAIRDSSGVLRYAGYSRNVRSRVAFHAGAVGPEAAATCQVYAPVDVDRVTADALEGVLEYWVSENGGVVPEGNLSGRDLWEQRDPREGQQQAQREQSVPFRARQTAKRVTAPSPSENARKTWTRSTAETFRSTWRSQSPRSGMDEDYVRVDVDPLDPFSPGRGGKQGRWFPLGEEDHGQPDEDWIPLVALMGVGTAIYVFSVLSNALPAASPTLGM